MPIQIVIVPNPAFDVDPVDLQSVTDYRDMPRKFECLSDDGDGAENGGPTDAQDPCQSPCAGEEGAVYIVERGDHIPLQFRLPDTVNPDPENPTYGWRESGEEYWLALSVYSPDHVLLFEGPTFQMASSYSVFMSESGPVQNVVIDVDTLLGHLPAGTTCFYFRLTIILARPDMDVANEFGEWEGDPPFTEVGTIVINTDADNFGIYELTPDGWEFLGLPAPGSVWWISSLGQFQQYTAASVIYTAHGGAEEFSFSKGSIAGAFTVTDTLLVDVGADTFLGGLVDGMRINPENPDEVFAATMRSQWFNGNLVVGTSKDGRGYTGNGGTSWSVQLGTDAPNPTVWQPLSTRVAYTPGGIAFVAIRGTGEVVPKILRHTGAGSMTTLNLTTASPLNGIASDVAAYDAAGNIVVTTLAGHIYWTDNGGTLWHRTDPVDGITAGLLCRVNGDRVLMVGDLGNKYSWNDARGTDAADWQPAQTLPNVSPSFKVTEVLSQGDTVWVFGYVLDEGTGWTGVMFRSANNGETFQRINSASVLGGKAARIGMNTLIATAWIGDSGLEAKAGIVYISTDAGDTWEPLANQPSGGAQALDGMVLTGTWAQVPPPGPLTPADDLPTDFRTTMTFRLRRGCNEKVVQFESEQDGVDCLGYVHDAPGEAAIGQNPLPFQHSFKLLGVCEVEELPIERQLTDNGQLTRVTLSTRARVRTLGIPHSVARKVQAVLGTKDFRVDGQPWDSSDNPKRNNDDGLLWWLDLQVTRQECTRGTSCD